MSAADRPEPEDDEVTAWSKRTKRLHRSAVLETLETIGFDVDDVHALQKDIMFLRKLRVASETAGAKTLSILMAAILAVVGALATLGVQYFLGNGKH